MIFAALRDAGLPHTFHWGQALPLNPHWVRTGYGDQRVDGWIAERNGFTTAAGRHMFSNRMTDQLGLT